ncbi:MAG: hypothetical protein ACRD0J_10855, partial [Acidimicrobiales bacterium]
MACTPGLAMTMDGELFDPATDRLTRLVGGAVPGTVVRPGGTVVRLAAAVVSGAGASVGVAPAWAPAPELPAAGRVGEAAWIRPEASSSPVVR